MADQDDMAAPLVMDLRLAVNLGHQRTGGIDGEECGERRFGNGLRNAMWATGASPSGTSSSSRTKTAPFLLQVLHHVFVVNDLMAHVDRRAMDRQRLLDGIDGERPRREAARGKQDIERRLRHDAAMWRERTSVKRE